MEKPRTRIVGHRTRGCALIRGGAYYRDIACAFSGAEGKPVRYAAYPGETPVIDGSRIRDDFKWWGLVSVEDAAWVVIEGFTLRSSPSFGVFVQRASNVVIRKVVTDDTMDSGILTWDCRDVVIEANEVINGCNDESFSNRSLPGHGSQECISIARTDGFLVRRNVIRDSMSGRAGGEGLDCKEGARNGVVSDNYIRHLRRIGFYFDVWNTLTGNIRIMLNVCTDTRIGFAVASEAGGTMENLVFENNVAYRNHDDGFTIGGRGDLDHGHLMRNTLVINNTFDGNLMGGVSIEDEHIDNIVIRNKIVSSNGVFQIGTYFCPDAVFFADHNLLSGYSAYEGEVTETDAILGTPAFADPMNADFRILAGSAAVDRANPLGAPLEDFGRAKRP